MLGRLLAFALGAALLLPVAAASSSRGSFVTADAITLPGDTNSTFAPLAFFAGNSTQLQGTLLSPTVRVWAFERQDVLVQTGVVPAVQIQKGSVQQRSFVVHEARVSFTPGNGFIGLYPEPQGSLDFRALGKMTLEPQSASVIPRGEPITDAPDLPVYNKRLAGPHFDITAPGTAAYAGPGAVKASGPLVHFKSRENATGSDFPTGVEQTSATERTTRWLYLESDAATLELATPEPIQMAAASIPVFASNGELAFTPTSGELDTDQGHYAPTPGAPATVTGRFTGTLAPSADGNAATITLVGDVRSTTLGTINAPVPTGPFISSFPWLGALVVGAVVVGGGAAVAVIVRQRGTQTAAPLMPPVGPFEREIAEEYATRALAAADGGGWTIAADLIARARRVDPTVALYALREGIYQFKAGHHLEAIEPLDVAAGLLDTGEPEWWAGKAAHDMGEKDLCERYFVAALDRRNVGAWIVEEIQRDRRYADVADRPSVKEALAHAQAGLSRRRQ